VHSKSISRGGDSGASGLSGKPVLVQVGLSGEADLTVERGAIVLRKPKKSARSGWAAAAQSIASQGEDSLLMGEFANEADSELAW
jgi:antitoxin MazE